LKAREQIKFFEEVLLFEDELHDHGVSSLSVKIVSAQINIIPHFTTASPIFPQHPYFTTASSILPQHPHLPHHLDFIATPHFTGLSLILQH